MGAAATLSATEILHQFNVVTFGDMTSNGDIEGRAYVGGNMTGGGQIINSRGKAPASDYDELVVRGNVTGGTVNLNNGGDATVGGKVANSTFELNGHGTLRAGGSITANANQGTKLANQAGAEFEARFPDDVEGVLKSASADLSGLVGVAPTVSGNRAVFNASPDAYGTTVYTFDFSFFDLVNEIELADMGASTLIFNISGLGGTLSDNFLGGPFALASKAVWNFYEAENLAFTRQFFGSVLAPYAYVTNTTPIEGSVVAASASFRGEVHLQPFAGDVPTPAPIPLPAGLPLLLGGLGLIGLVARRRTA